MKTYVLGFLFTNNGGVWLIRKSKPEWQAGFLNGIGGKIEPNETAINAMQREFIEEAGLIIPQNDWYCYATISDDKTYEVHCYCAYSDATATTMTDEHVKLCYTASLPSNVIPNLRWLIPMALSFRQGERAHKFNVKEMYKVD